MVMAQVDQGPLLMSEIQNVAVLMNSARLSSGSDNLYTDTKKLTRRPDDLTDQERYLGSSYFTPIDFQALRTEIRKLLACVPFDSRVAIRESTVDDLIIKKSTCFHPSFKKKICMTCGREANDDNTYASIIYDTSIPFRYIDKDLRYNRGEIARLKENNTKEMLSRRKLHLVLDLDHTLLHSASYYKLKESEKYLWNSFREHSMTGELFYVSSVQWLTKTRPGVREFLKKVSTMFDMHVYTMGTRNYAKDMARLLDPHGVYFGSRIVSREDCTRHHLKSLDVILGKEKATLILDDTKEAWPNHMENLISIKKYFFFAAGQSKCIDNIQSLAEMKRSGKSEGDTALSNVLKILTKVHTRFFEEHNPRKPLKTDVRGILKRVKRE